MTDWVVVDAETYSELDVTEVGHEVYARHPSTEVILWSVFCESFPEPLVFEEPNIWRVLLILKKEGEIRWSKKSPLDVLHWGAFDRAIVQAKCIAAAGETWGEMDEVGVWTGPNNTRWGDISEVSLLLGGPFGLEHGAAFYAGAEKLKGSHLIRRFSKPDKKLGRIRAGDDPARWQEFRRYAAQDSYAAACALSGTGALIDEVGERLEAHDGGRGVVARMNARGVPLDVPAISRAASIIQRQGSRLAREALVSSGVNINAPAQVAAFLGLENAQRETIEAFLDALDQEGVAERSAAVDVAEARLVVSGAAHKKLGAMLDRMSPDHRLRGAWVYHGAWTRRMTSTGAQLQNLVRHKVDEEFFTALDQGELDEDLAIFARTRANIRGFIKAPPGATFIAADYAQIELRVAAWLAGETWLVDALAEGKDVYRITAGAIYGRDPEKVTSEERQLGKVVELASQFGLSGIGWDGESGLYARLQREGITMTKSACKRIINIYRATHPNIVKMWQAFEDALYRLCGDETGREMEVGSILIRRTEHAVVVERPSGFRQYLWEPGIEHGVDDKSSIVYTGRTFTGGMGPLHTYGAKAFQGAVQGIAADILYEGAAAAEAAGYAPVMMIHDELVTEVSARDKKKSVENLCELISRPPAWAKGLPIKAEGWRGGRFTK